MAKSPIDRIAEMLSDEAPERRLAAVIVLGELKAKSSSVQDGLLRILQEDAPAIQKHAVDTLRRVGVSKKGLDAVWPLLASRDPQVRAAAAAAIASVGASVVSDVRGRLAEAEGDERRALESVLSHLGGKEAFDALLDALAEGDEESNRVTALELRTHVKQADAATRRSYRTRLEKFLEQKDLSAVGRAAGVKVLGFLEDSSTGPLLLKLAKDKKTEPSVRQEAWIALRFTMKDGASADLVKGLVDTASADDRSLAQTALMTLAALPLPASLAGKLSALALHPDIERARFAIEKLGSMSGAAATQTLVEIVAEGDRRRAELAAAALEKREDALGPLVDLLAKTPELERAKLIHRVVSQTESLPPAALKKLLDAGATKLADDVESWEPALALVRDRDIKLTMKRLTADIDKARKSRKAAVEARILRGMVRLGVAAEEERYRLAAMRLKESALDPRARRADQAFEGLLSLARRGYDVVSALKKDRGVGLEELYYVGFCLIEEDVGGGEELLEHVIEKGGRKKIAAAAKNKLKLGA
ncbi:MAG: HEAT repeat domain-containing protein [Sandaracinaceae bacterium]